MSRQVEYLAARVRRLADVLTDLRERVRAAVASELGRAVGDAVRDILTALVNGGPAPEPDGASRPARAWDDEPDPWDETDDNPRPVRRAEPVPVAVPIVQPAGSIGRFAEAAAVAAVAARFWVARGAPGWVGVGLGLAAGAAAWAGGPLARAAAAALAAASELMAVGAAPRQHLTSRPPR